MPKENKSILRTKPTVTMTSAMSSAVSFSKKEPAPVESKPKVAKEIKFEGVPEPKLPTAKDILRLRYIRFRSLDLELTIDFYTTIGMNVEFKSEQELWKNPNLMRRNTTNQIQGKSKAVEKNRVIVPQTFKKMVVSLSFKVSGSTSMDPNENIQLIFEKEDRPPQPVRIIY
jgi:hypothetical protein